MNENQRVYENYRGKIDEIISRSVTRNLPKTLYDPLRYVLNSGGKRIRPMMVIFSCEAAGGSFDDSSNAAVALEMLHNFTLVHDDIMDNADTRRGELTVHKKWDDNVAILAGDQLIGLAYVYLLKTNSHNIEEIAKAFTEGIIEVCEGQAYDKEYESGKDISIDDYMLMIRKKTAKMLETSAAVGSLTGGAGKEFVMNVKEFAMNTGLAFQILDDLLDIVSDETEFGKKKGGDVVEGKKTYLLLKAKELSSGEDREIIEQMIQRNNAENIDDNFIERVRTAYERSGAIASAREEIERFTSLAGQCLERLPESAGRDRLKWLAEMLMNRKF